MIWLVNSIAENENEVVTVWKLQMESCGGRVGVVTWRPVNFSVPLVHRIAALSLLRIDLIFKQSLSMS